MPDPTTSNVLLAIPTRGSDSGVWDTPVNGDFTALDGMLGGQATLSLSSATTLALSLPATGTVSAAAGPNQSQNACIKLTGNLSGTTTLQVTMPRRYLFDTTGLTVGTSVVVVAPATGTGNAVGLPPGELTMVWFDGTNCTLLGLGRVGSYLDVAVATTEPWMRACTVMPYLPCDGATYTTSLFPALGSKLGSTFGGNGITTFAVPDARNRFSLPIDQSGQGRVTSAGSGVDGTSLGATGGSQFMQQHNHGLTDPGHSHTFATVNQYGPGGQNAYVSTGTSRTDTATTGITVNNAGTGTSQNIPPTLVSGCRFIKT